MPSITIDSLPTGFTLTGAIPIKNQDLAASIIFIVAYICLVPLLALRVGRKISRTTLLIRPAIFILIRIGTFIVRAVQAGGDESERLFIAQQILLLCGFFLLVEPLTALVKYNLYRDWIPQGKKDHLSVVFKLMRWAVLGALSLGIAVGARTNDSFTDPDLARTLKRCRYASAILGLVVIGISLFLVLFAQITGVSEWRRTSHLTALSICLLIPSVYRLVAYAEPAHLFSSAGKAIFYLFFCLPEVLATLLYVTINLETTFELKEGAAKDKWNTQAQKGKVAGSYGSENELERDGNHEMSEKGSV